MRNITVSVDDHVYEAARARAKTVGTSLSRVAKSALEEFVAHSDRDQARRDREVFYARIDAKLAGLTGDAAQPGWRDELYDEARVDDPQKAARAA